MISAYGCSNEDVEFLDISSYDGVTGIRETIVYNGKKTRIIYEIPKETKVSHSVGGGYAVKNPLEIDDKEILEARKFCLQLATSSQYGDTVKKAEEFLHFLLSGAGK